MATKMYEMMCTRCGDEYIGSKKSYFCPVCRKERQREAARERNLSKLGNMARREHMKEREQT